MVYTGESLLQSCRQLRGCNGSILHRQDLIHLLTIKTLFFNLIPWALFQIFHKHPLRKFLCWTVGLRAYNYTCIHINVNITVWVDLLWRWSAPSVIRQLIQIPALWSSSSEYFEWLLLPERQNAQQKINTHPNNVERGEGL